MRKIEKRHAIVIATAISALLGIVAFQQTNAAGSKSNEVRSMAWYAANLKIAEAKNKECRADPNNTELQSTPDCVNALQAVELRFGVKR